DEKSTKTILSYEFPCEYEEDKNERYYPIPNDENQKLYEKYLNESAKLNNVYFLGRLGDYKYYDMDKAVERVLKFAKEVIL
ncbi:UDP-galactopyranose mutase, partial [Campylobacter jejuni]|nr:UDP-galactopyranose mutase [Campylobacter jejuni]